MTIQAPYRFVPLSKLIVLPDWGSKVSHDKPFKDGICGELDVIMTTQSDICVGGEQTPSTSNEAGVVRFFRTPDGKPAIPASSLKGMLRNVLEIATFSRFKQVEDQKLGVRDISQSKNFYTEAITRQKPQAGWLKFDGQKWVITPCSFARVHQQNIIEYFNISYDDWSLKKTIKQRYLALGLCPDINFEDRFETKNTKTVATLKSSAKNKGQLIVTGQPGPAFKANKSAKKYEFIFFNAQKDKVLIISPSVMSGFKQIHADTDEWKFWLANITNLPNGIPVFYHTEASGSVRSLGLAYMYKLAYDHGIYDAIGHTNKQHLQQEQPDFADLLFGFIDDEHALRGRVNIGLGFLSTEDAPLTTSQATVLSSPKATYYPLYIRQTNHKEFNQLMQNTAQLAGWKRYQSKPVNILPPPDKSKATVQVKFETVSANTVFDNKIRFHNLRPVELGALLWALDFGGRKELNHQIGVGKPYGLGQIKLNLGGSKLRRNDAEHINDNHLFLMACRQEFVDYMQGIFKSFNEDWEKSDTLQALFQYATMSNAGNLDYLDTPKAYADLRKKEFLGEFIENFHQYSPTIPHDASLDFYYQNNLDAQIEKVAEILSNHEKAKEREKIKANATIEDKILLELEDFIAQATVEVTKTIKGNANKTFKRPFDESWDYFDDVQKQKFKELANQAGMLIEDKALGKLIKKINEAE